MNESKLAKSTPKSSRKTSDEWPGKLYGRVGEGGRVTIPQWIRQKVKIRAGDIVSYDYLGNNTVIITRESRRRSPTMQEQYPLVDLMCMAAQNGTLTWD